LAQNQNCVRVERHVYQWIVVPVRPLLYKSNFKYVGLVQSEHQHHIKM